MKILNDLIELLGDNTSSLSSALVKAQILAHRLGDAELAAWVEHELRGYPDDVDVPPYRVVRISLIGNISNGYYHYQNQTLPTHHLKADICEKITTTHVRESVASVEGWAHRDDIVVTIPSAALGLFSKALTSTYAVQQAWGKIGVGAGQGILTEIRSRLLEFCLKIADRIPENISDSEIKETAEMVGANDVFRNAVFGDNNTIVVGGGSISNVTNSVTKNDLDSLLAELQRVGVQQKDLEALKEAVAADSTSVNLSRREWGPRVSAWVGAMIGKAGTGAWEVTKGVAAAVLAAAISAFYGFGT